jgi:hypothetical protein
MIINIEIYMIKFQFIAKIIKIKIRRICWFTVFVVPDIQKAPLWKQGPILTTA